MNSVNVLTALPVSGFPIRKSADITAICASPQLIAAYRVLRRLPVPRHSPCALCSLNFRSFLHEFRKSVLFCYYCSAIFRLLHTHYFLQKNLIYIFPVFFRVLDLLVSPILFSMSIAHFNPFSRVCWALGAWTPKDIHNTLWVSFIRSNMYTYQYDWYVFLRFSPEAWFLNRSW